MYSILTKPLYSVLETIETTCVWDALCRPQRVLYHTMPSSYLAEPATWRGHVVFSVSSNCGRRQTQIVIANAKWIATGCSQTARCSGTSMTICRLGPNLFSLTEIWKVLFSLNFIVRGDGLTQQGNKCLTKEINFDFCIAERKSIFRLLLVGILRI